MINIENWVAPYRKIPIICGPTASGKSSLALRVCREISGELMSMDSMQVYRGMDIGTAKASTEEQAQVPHHLLDLVEPTTDYSPVQYLTSAYQAIDIVLQTGKLPVFCGGTGQYASALSLGIEYVPVEIDPFIREKLRIEIQDKGPEALYEELRRVDPLSAEKIHPNNAKRLLRAMEIYRQTGRSKTEFDAESTKSGPRYPFAVFVIERPREELYRRIDQRVDQMITDGLVEEATKLYLEYAHLSSTSKQAIGYKELFQYFAQEISLDEAIDLIKKNTRNYAKRQITWFSHMKDVTVISANDVETILHVIRE